MRIAIVELASQMICTLRPYSTSSLSNDDCVRFICAIAAAGAALTRSALSSTFGTLGQLLPPPSAACLRLLRQFVGADLTSSERPKR